VVLVDLHLGGEDGFDFIERLHAAFPEVAVIAISEEMSQADQLTKLKARGAEAVLPKPITPEWKVVVERFRAMRRKS
jgi:CheY-like chemotaxis protein